MYPDFVLVKESNPFNGARVLEICRQKYIAHASDHYIDKAIELARQWQPQQVTYARVVYLRDWIRLNEDYHVPMVGVKSVMGCKEFVDRVMAAEFLEMGCGDRAAFVKGLKENESVFFEEEFIDTT